MIKIENHNIYINDKNRKCAKIYNNGRWDATSSTKLDNS